MVIINGVSYSGNNVTVCRNKVIIDGVEVTDKNAIDGKIINITIDSPVDKLHVDACESIKIIGNVGDVSTLSGDVDIEGSVSGSVKTMSGDVDCGAISGSVTTMSGDIKTRK